MDFLSTVAAQGSGAALAVLLEQPESLSRDTREALARNLATPLPAARALAADEDYPLWLSDRPDLAGEDLRLRVSHCVKRAAAVPGPAGDRPLGRLGEAIAGGTDDWFTTLVDGQCSRELLREPLDRALTYVPQDPARVVQIARRLVTPAPANALDRLRTLLAAHPAAAAIVASDDSLPVDVQMCGLHASLLDLDGIDLLRRCLERDDQAPPAPRPGLHPRWQVTPEAKTAFVELADRYSDLLHGRKAIRAVAAVYRPVVQGDPAALLDWAATADPDSIETGWALWRARMLHAAQQDPSVRRHLLRHARQHDCCVISSVLGRQALADVPLDVVGGSDARTDKTGLTDRLSALPDRTVRIVLALRGDGAPHRTLNDLIEAAATIV